MKITAIIPARYNSSRFPGKPLADIIGKPMIWHVYNRVKRTKGVTDTVVATDDRRILDVCHQLNIKAVLTGTDHKTSTSRVYEVAKRLDVDLYIVVNGDEPLIAPMVIQQIIPSNFDRNDFYVGNLMTKIVTPSETVDFTNIKVVTDNESNAVFYSRSPIPYPKSSLNFDYY